jgi:hypothetical protein
MFSRLPGPACVRARSCSLGRVAKLSSSGVTASVRCWLQGMAGPCREMEVRDVKAARKDGRLGQVLRGQCRGRRRTAQEQQSLSGVLLVWPAC